MDGEYIIDRKIEDIIAAIAAEQGISYESFSDGWVQVLKKDDTVTRLIGYKWSINDAAAGGIASDKVATYQVLHAAGVPALEHVLLRTKADFQVNWPAVVPSMFVLKPLMGTSGHGIRLFNDTSAAESFISEQRIVAWALSPLRAIEREIRIIMLDGESLLAYEKHPSKRGELTFFNLGKGATAETIAPPAELVMLATRAVTALGLRLAAVDVIYAEGVWQVLEVNDGFMMEHFLRQSPENYELTVQLYKKIIDASFLPIS